MNRTKVFLTGGEGNGWALDEDLRLARAAIQDRVELVDLYACDVIHAAWWESLLSLPVEELIRKPVICHVAGEPYRYMSLPAHMRVMNLVTRWITRTGQAHQQLERIGISSRLAPYLIDVNTFRPLDMGGEITESFRRRWQIPNDSYLIGSFQRDTEGSDLSSPKLTKGPDVFLEIVRTLAQRGLKIHVTLAGPRRHWLIARLKEHEIPFTYVGCEVGYDDLEMNALSRTDLNILYNLIDLCLVASRSEGGPHSVLEAAAAGCEVLSPPVGTAPDTLEPESIFRSPPEAVEKIQADIQSNSLGATVNPQYRRVRERHVSEAVGPIFQSVYESLDKVSVKTRGISPSGKSAMVNTVDSTRLRQSGSSFQRKRESRILSLPGPRSCAERSLDPSFRWGDGSLPRPTPGHCVRITPPESATLRARVRGRRNRVEAHSVSSNRITVGLWHTFFEPPYGGGNQFMLALKKALGKLGVEVRENELGKGIDAYLLNSIHFDVDRFRAMAQSTRINVIHRVDGPIHLIRGFDREKDELCFALNAEFASATILQSAWTLQRIVEMGYRPRNPLIIHNAADPAVFHTRDRIPFRRDRKIKLISTSWSDNPRKGGSDYRWLDDHLDWDRFEYTFVGNLSEELTRARHLSPVSSDALADILRDHDIYITASRNDPCSNALIEALTCGLPALYLNDGGHPELVGYGGLPFETREDMLSQLDRLVENYEMFQALLAPPRMEETALKYVTLIREVLSE